jgi:hypothetical protein
MAADTVVTPAANPGTTEGTPAPPVEQPTPDPASTQQPPAPAESAPSQEPTPPSKANADVSTGHPSSTDTAPPSGDSTAPAVDSSSKGADSAVAPEHSADVGAPAVPPLAGTGASDTSDSSVALLGSAGDPLGPSSGSKAGDIAPAMRGITLYGLPGVNTGGTTLLLASSLACVPSFCSHPSATFVTARIALARHADVAAAGMTFEASQPPLLPLPGLPGDGPPPNSSLVGGSGGGMGGFALLSLVAALAIAFSSARWTKIFGLPAVTWPPSAYVPPIEAPG